MKNSLLIVLLIATTSAGYASNVSAYSQKEIDCLAENIYYEANAEPLEGKIAVAQVTVNRSNNAKYPDSICKVVYQKSKSGGTVTCQFSWVCERHRRKIDIEDLISARKIAIAVLSDKEGNPKLADALYFHAKHVRTSWSAVRVATIGNHIFYRDRSEM